MTPGRWARAKSAMAHPPIALTIQVVRKTAGCRAFDMLDRIPAIPPPLRE